MHPEAYEAVKMMRDQAFKHQEIPWFEGLDVGGSNHNGTARDLFSETTWDIIDPHGGEGVIPEDFLVWEPPHTYDIILCTEVFEHTSDWKAIVQKAHDILNTGGVMFVTCAGEGRQTHGAFGDPSPAEGEWYQNIDTAELKSVFDRLFYPVHGYYNYPPGDLYYWGMK